MEYGSFNRLRVYDITCEPLFSPLLCLDDRPRAIDLYCTLDIIPPYLFVLACLKKGFLLICLLI